MLSHLLSVALGGALGASARFLVGVAALRLIGPGFPWGTLAVNLLGSAAIGAFIVLAAHRGLGHLNYFVITGFLGGFTTFSAFSIETARMMEQGAVGHATIYVTGSVVGGILALVLAMAAMRALLA